MAVVDRNNLAFWYPPLHSAGLPVPRTIIVQTDVPLMDILDGKEPPGLTAFLDDLQEAVQTVGAGEPVFLRTGHTSGKHSWSRTCFVEDPERLARHVSALVEASALAGIFGLPTSTWAVRELISTVPVFYCVGYGGMPVTREFRLFVRDGRVEHVQPYWPPDAVEQGMPDSPRWRVSLSFISRISSVERDDIFPKFAHAVGSVLPGFWSVDVLQDGNGKWWLTDMADGDQSFRWEP